MKKLEAAVIWQSSRLQGRCDGRRSATPYERTMSTKWQTTPAWRSCSMYLLWGVLPGVHEIHHIPAMACCVRYIWQKLRVARFGRQ